MRRVFVRFLEEIEDTKKTFRNYLTFRVYEFLILVENSALIKFYEHEHFLFIVRKKTGKYLQYYSFALL